MNDWSPPLMSLLQLQQQFERGPKREGAFALWLAVRAALDVGLTSAPRDPSEHRSVALLAQRLAPLAVPRSLARGITAALGYLAEGTPASARVALSQLVAPAKDALGNEAADAVAQAARMVHDHQAVSTG